MVEVTDSGLRPAEPYHTSTTLEIEWRFHVIPHHMPVISEMILIHLHGLNRFQNFRISNNFIYFVCMLSIYLFLVIWFTFPYYTYLYFDRVIVFVFVTTVIWV